MIPISTIIFPKYIIDELLGKQRAEYLVSFIIGMLSLNFLGDFFTNFFEGKIFVTKGIVFNRFQYDMSEKLLGCDYENIENPEFFDIKEQAGKFLYANGMGFGAVWDSAFNIICNIFVFACIVAVNLKIGTGEKLAVIGENDAGKTTFVKLLMRLYARQKDISQLTELI